MWQHHPIKEKCHSYWKVVAGGIFPPDSNLLLTTPLELLLQSQFLLSSWVTAPPSMHLVQFSTHVLFTIRKCGSPPNNAITFPIHLITIHYFQYCNFPSHLSARVCLMKSAQSTLPQLTPVSTVSYKPSPFCCHLPTALQQNPKNLKPSRGNPLVSSLKPI
jgi:hypothetical protein